MLLGASKVVPRCLPFAFGLCFHSPARDSNSLCALKEFSASTYVAADGHGFCMLQCSLACTHWIVRSGTRGCDLDSSGSYHTHWQIAQPLLQLQANYCISYLNLVRMELKYSEKKGSEEPLYNVPSAITSIPWNYMRIEQLVRIPIQFLTVTAHARKLSRLTISDQASYRFLPKKKHDAHTKLA